MWLLTFTFKMGNCCDSGNKSKQTEFDTLDKGKEDAKRPRKNSYTKDPTNLPAPGTTQPNTEELSGSGGNFYI